jgi:hypothetical protein
MVTSKLEESVVSGSHSSIVPFLGAVQTLLHRVWLQVS